jgi:hypothetical protein
MTALLRIAKSHDRNQKCPLCTLAVSAYTNVCASLLSGDLRTHPIWGKYIRAS